MDELSELRARLNNNLLASDTHPGDFAQKAGIGVGAVRRFLTGPHKYKTHYTVLEAIQRAMREEGWLPPVEPVSGGFIQSLVEEVAQEQPSLSLQLSEPQAEPQPLELTNTEKRFLTYAIYHARETEQVKLALFLKLGL